MIDRELTDEEAQIELETAREWVRRMNTDWSEFPFPPTDEEMMDLGGSDVPSPGVDPWEGSE